MVASGPDAALYGQPRPRKSGSREISASGSLAFTSQLTSLLSQSDGKKKPRATRTGKDDIFSAHNRNTHKRAARDEAALGLDQKHTTNGEAVDASAWHRSRRKMEDKARLYAAMKRGDVEDEDGKHMVDFDRKWAERQDQGEDGADSSDDSTASADEEQVEWTDEFGRARTGTRAQMARAQRAEMLKVENEHRARPAAPQGLIYGDTVQDEAFNPDTVVSDKMAELASKRDKSLTPPPDTHFDGSKEVRTKGVGFMHFSRDEAQRQSQMEALEKERDETQRLRDKRGQKIQERKAEVERRRREIQERRDKRKADDFLDDLGAELEAKRQA